MLKKNYKMVKLLRNAEGAVFVPIILWVLGVPFIVVIILWLIFFRG